MFVEGARIFSVWFENRVISREKHALCFCSVLFICLFYIMINCIVFWEVEMVHVKRTEWKNTIWKAAGASFKIKRGSRNDKEFENN